MAEIFLDEYFRHVPRHWRDRLAPHYAGACSQVALYYLQHLVESGPQRIAERLTAVRSALDGRLF